MDSSLDFLDTRQIAAAVCRSHKSVQNNIRIDPTNPARGLMQFQHASLPLVRIGRTWLTRRGDLEAILSPGAPATAPAAASPRRGRRRKSATGRQGV